MIRGFSWMRCYAMFAKELSQLMRDHITLIMQVAIPIFQLVLMGYAIDYNPRHLPAAVVTADQSEITRDLLMELKNSSYFKFVKEYPDIKQARSALQDGKVLLVVQIPPNFTADFFHHNVPEILVEADASNPVATASAMNAVTYLQYNSLQHTLHGLLAQYQATSPSFKFIEHARYNPGDITTFSIVPGLIGVVVFMTLISMCSLTIVRERESGTMESLLVKPITPSEVMLGKILPYVVLGYFQIFLLLGLGKLLFNIPIAGSIWTLLVATLPFVLSGLAIGIAISSFAGNQLQSMQLTIFIYMPNIVLTGFAFPFAGMPAWAQAISNILPLTHFIRIIRGILLKGNGWVQIWPNVWPIILFAVVLMGIAILTYRRKLD